MGVMFLTTDDAGCHLDDGQVAAWAAGSLLGCWMDCSPSLPDEASRNVLLWYYKSHQPSYGRPFFYNDPTNPQPPTPCYCEACKVVRNMGTVLMRDRSRQQLWIMQGAPGSGKSTMAQRIAAENGAIICSTDTYFLTPDRRYLFDASKLAINHQKNLRRAVALMDEGWSVVVDNTNVQRWACREYVRHAVKLGISVDFVRATGSFANTHGVPSHIVANMRTSMEDLTVDSVLASLTPAEAEAQRKREEAQRMQQMLDGVGGGGGDRPPYTPHRRSPRGQELRAAAAKQGDSKAAGQAAVATSAAVSLTLVSQLLLAQHDPSSAAEAKVKEGAEVRGGGGDLAGGEEVGGREKSAEKEEKGDSGSSNGDEVVLAVGEV